MVPFAFLASRITAATIRHMNCMQISFVIQTCSPLILLLCIDIYNSVSVLRKINGPNIIYLRLQSLRFHYFHDALPILWFINRWVNMCFFLLLLRSNIDLRFPLPWRKMFTKGFGRSVVFLFIKANWQFWIFVWFVDIMFICIIVFFFSLFANEI